MTGQLMLKWLFVYFVIFLGVFLNVALPVFAFDATVGAQVFETHCVGCHIGGGNIVRRGKTLKQNALQKNGFDNVAAIAALVKAGKGNMSAYQDRLSEAEIQAVSAYVLEQADQGWRS
jgi:cytochrome c6